MKQNGSARWHRDLYWGLHWCQGKQWSELQYATMRDSKTGEESHLSCNLAPYTAVGFVYGTLEDEVLNIRADERGSVTPASRQPREHRHFMGQHRGEVAMTYLEYHKAVVAACVELMGEQSREFWDKTCSYEDEFERGDTPEECAQNQWESLT